MKRLIKKLSNMHAISGYEHCINEEIKKIMEPLCDEVYIDNTGSVIAVKRCGAQDAKKVMLEAHADEIGLMVKDIDERGFLTVVSVGGIDPRVLPCSEVIVHGKKDVPGVIGAKPPHLTDDGDKKATKLVDMAVDTGFSASEVKKLISIGDSVTVDTACRELLQGQLSGKALDDRACLAALIGVLENLKDRKLNVDLYVVAATKEEVGGFGAMTAAYSIMPDIAIAVDVCHGITPDNSHEAYEVGSGAIVTCGPNIHPKVFERLMDTAKNYKIKTQIEATGGNTGTDAWVIQTAREGIPTGLLSVPLKYMHTSVETLKVTDVKAVCSLLTHFVEDLDSNPEDWLCL